uniref:Uncharacterized protein n=1 Tax=Cajanus cajan TaxID=3821 RepID=A0A151TMH1_CAJCA|nr:hypothetical protein KK1_021856 [Cajanus cajan]KYP68240.1 hypothetical protein KK1_021861 [Cajanus cajan]KYP68243.1 hypothetical protein KK1_021864 [Cajanus cajan]
MNSAEICVFKKTNEIGLGGFLKSRDSTALESEIGLEILSDFPHQPLERKLPDEKLGALLVLADLPQRHRARPETVGLLHAAGGRSRLTCGLRRQLLPRSLSSGGLPCGLLGTSH